MDPPVTDPGALLEEEKRTGRLGLSLRRHSQRAGSSSRAVERDASRSERPERSDGIRRVALAHRRTAPVDTGGAVAGIAPGVQSRLSRRPVRTLRSLPTQRRIPSSPNLNAVSFAGRLDAENEAECVVDRSQLARFETAGRPSEALRVDHSGLLDENAGLSTLDDDRRAEARRPRTDRSRSDQRRTEIEKLIRLDDYCEACAALFVPARAPSRGQAEDLAANHYTADGGARSAICSRIKRISSRSAWSAARRRTSSRIADLTRRRAAASRRAVRTASESVRPSARTTSSAAAALSSRRM